MTWENILFWPNEREGGKRARPFRARLPLSPRRCFTPATVNVSTRCVQPSPPEKNPLIPFCFTAARASILLFFVIKASDFLLHAQRPHENSFSFPLPAVVSFLHHFLLVVCFSASLQFDHLPFQRKSSIEARGSSAAGTTARSRCIALAHGC